MAPQDRYRAAAANPRLLPRANPTSKTPKFASVRGTGVNGRGNTNRAHTAITALAPMTIPACFARLDHCSETCVCVLTAVGVISLSSSHGRCECRITLTSLRQRVCRQLHCQQVVFARPSAPVRSEEYTSELQS